MEGGRLMRHETEEERWAYNCEDCVRTLEIAEVEQGIIAKMGLDSPHALQQAILYPVLDAMIKGVRVDKSLREEMRKELEAEAKKREEYFLTVLGHKLNPKSPKQMMKLFYEDLKQPVIMKRGTKGKAARPTLDDEALTKVGNREPILRPLLRRIAEYRSIGVFRATFIEAPLDIDDRMRCSYNVCGTSTYRLSSSENAFGSGTNLQNLPKGTVAKEPEDLVLPNVRRMFVPDVGYTFFDMDLDRADLQVVVWEANDDELKSMLRAGVDIHSENAKTLNCSRQMAKSWVHGTNYGGSPRTMAANCGLLVRDAEAMQRRWFQAHPGIEQWHRRTDSFLKSRRYVENRFGYRFYWFERTDGVLPEALAWIPQSTVALVINRIWQNIYTNVPGVQVLLQVHDSLAGQFRTEQQSFALSELRRASDIVVPYDDPLVIPTGIKTSTVSWGDCA
jgi:DNA polymerase I-like protein with 3'-5' exonuclease and polymerase domains